MGDVTLSTGEPNASGDQRIVLGLLSSVERDGAQTQRRLAAELGIALGLVNTYLRRCVKKGLLKVSEAPARRYAYYLTPQGFAEKSRLTVEYLSWSLEFFRKARTEATALLLAAKARRMNRFLLIGAGDMAELMVLSAIEADAEIVGILDPLATSTLCAGKPVHHSFAALRDHLSGRATSFDAVVIATADARLAPFELAEKVCAEYSLPMDRTHILVPDVLKLVWPATHGGET